MNPSKTGGALMTQKEQNQSEESGMFRLLENLYPLHRTINSDDFEKALNWVGAYVGKGFRLLKYEPGTSAFTWIVPERYCVDEAYIECEGKKYANFAENNLSLVSYSIPVDKIVSYDELSRHVHTSKTLPSEIPWVFKYYEKDWGFCLRENEWKTFDPKKTYHVVIKSRFEKKPFLIGEFFIPGKTDEEILWVSDLCHPNQVNDSISGAVVAAQAARELSKNYQGRYSIRFLFLAETIGSIVWFSRNEGRIKKIRYGMFCEMVGNQNRFLLKLSRQGNTELDRIAKNVFAGHEQCGKTEVKPFLGTVPGNDEKVMNSVGIDIPTISFSRWPYQEYHTSADNPSMIHPENLEEAKAASLEILRILNANKYPVYLSRGPVFLSRYGLWVDAEKDPKLNKASQTMLQLLDGKHTVLDIAEEVGLDFDTTYTYLKKFEENKLIRWNAQPK